MAETDREQVVSLLRACIGSMKGGVPMRNLNCDYKMLAGDDIPYQKMGYQTLEQFLKSVPDVSLSLVQGGEVILKAIPNKNTAHVASMVSKQKSSSKRTRHSSRNAPLRRSAASLQRPTLSSVVVRPSKVLPADDTRLPLSITVTNRTETVQCSSGKPARQVSLAVSSSKRETSYTQPFSGGSTGGEISHQKFEKPPRFLKLSPQGNSTPVPAAPPSSASASVPALVPAAATVPAPVSTRLSVAATVPVPAAPVVLPVASSVHSKAQGRLQQVKATAKQALKKDNVKLSGTEAGDSRAANNSFEVTSSGGRAIASPLTPLHARLCVAVQKPVQVQTTSSQEEEFMAASFGGGENFTKQLEDFAVAKGMNKPAYSVVPNMTAGKLSYSCFVKLDDLSISSYPDLRSSPGEAMNVVAKRALEEIEHRSKMTQDNNMIMSRIAYSPVVDAPNISMEMSHTQIPVSPVQSVLPKPVTLPQDDVWDFYITCGNSTAEIWGRLIGEDYSVQYENLATDMEMFYMEQVNVVPNPEVGSFYAIKMDDCWHRVELLEMDESCTEGWVFFIDHGDEEKVSLKELHLLEQCFVRLPAQAVRCFLWGLEDFADDPNAACHITDIIVGKALVASVKSLPSAKNPGVGVVLYDTSTEEDLNLNIMLLDSISKDPVAPQLPPEGKAAEVYMSHVTDTGDVFLQFKSYSYVHSLVCSLIETCLRENIDMRGCKSPCPDPSQLYLARYHQDGNWYRAAITKKLDGQKEVEVIFVDFGNTEVVNQSDLVLLETLKKSVAEFPHQAIKVRLHNVPYSSFSERLRELVPFNECVLVKTISARPSNNIPLVEIFKRIQPDNLLVSINSTLAFDADLKPLPKPVAGDGHGLRGRKRLERPQRLGPATSNSCQPYAASSGNSTVAPNSLSPVAPNSLSPVAPNSLSAVAPNSLSAVAPSSLRPVSFSSHENEATSKGLSPPQIPAIGDYFDVHVTMAANPGNFTVQPYKDIIRLEEMMESMQTKYKEQKYPHPPLDSVKEGELCAALHHDGHWYRVCVTNVMNDNMVSVYFCDYGDVSVLPLEKLQPLTDQFKELPYQGIKAKLAGIQPKHSDWSVEDCLMFQELVVERDFVSIVVEKGPDLLNPASVILGLRLVDTSGVEDIYVGELLVSQDRAVVRTAS